MPASDDQPSTPAKRRAPKPNRMILLLILAAAIGILILLISNQGAATVVVQPPPTPTQTPFVSTPTVEASMPASPEPETSPPQPVPMTAPTTWATPSAPGFGTAAPAKPEDVAGVVGGSPDEWSKHDERGQSAGDNGWVYRGSSPLQFVIPSGIVIDTSQGRLGVGAQIDATSFTIYWVPGV